MKNIISLLFFLFTNIMYSQIPNEGTFVFENSEVKLTIKLLDYGTTVATSKLYFKASKKVFLSKGEWTIIDDTNLPEDYPGPFGWFEIYEGNYKYNLEFDYPNKSLIIKPISKFLLKDNVVKYKSYTK
jgi:hypothetical protein